MSAIAYNLEQQRRVMLQNWRHDLLKWISSTCGQEFIGFREACQWLTQHPEHRLNTDRFKELRKEMAFYKTMERRPA